jgi:hypothetical protein
MLIYTGLVQQASADPEESLRLAKAGGLTVANVSVVNKPPTIFEVSHGDGLKQH